ERGVLTRLSDARAVAIRAARGPVPLAQPDLRPARGVDRSGGAALPDPPRARAALARARPIACARLLARPRPLARPRALACARSHGHEPQPDRARRRRGDDPLPV